MSRRREALIDELHNLSEEYKIHWAEACKFEGAEPTAVAVEFTEGNPHAPECVRVMKEMTSISSALRSNMIK